MRLALLSGANPLVAKDGPKVRLAKGVWKIRYDGVRESGFMLVLTSRPFANPLEDQVVAVSVSDGHELNLEFPAVVYVMFKQRGQERFLSVFAERVA